MLSALIITFFMVLILGIGFSLVRPIFEWIHYLIVDLFRSIGFSYMGARAITSIVIIVVILMILF